MQPKAAKKVSSKAHTHINVKTKSGAFSPALDLSLFFRFCYGHERELTDEADIP